MVDNDQFQLPDTGEEALSVLTPEATETPEGEKGKKAYKKKKKGIVRVVPRGKAFVQATYNNTIVTVSDLGGNVLAWSSAGGCGFKGPKKSTSFAASVVVRELMKKLEGRGLKDVQVYVKGIGAGRESAIRALHANGLEISSIKDITPIPHNGPRKRKPRRV